MATLYRASVILFAILTNRFFNQLGRIDFFFFLFSENVYSANCIIPFRANDTILLVLFRFIDYLLIWLTPVPQFAVCPTVIRYAVLSRAYRDARAAVERVSVARATVARGRVPPSCCAVTDISTCVRAYVRTCVPFAPGYLIRSLISFFLSSRSLFSFFLVSLLSIISAPCVRACMCVHPVFLGELCKLFRRNSYSLAPRAKPCVHVYVYIYVVIWFRPPVYVLSFFLVSLAWLSKRALAR